MATTMIGKRRRKLLTPILVGAAWWFTAMSASGQTQPVWREDFQALAAWKPIMFPKIERHTRYSIQTMDTLTVLKAEADASASSLIHTQTFDPHQTAVLRWRWRVENVYRKGDATRKDGDDYPLRVYVLFAYDPKRASVGMQVKYALARRLYGDYPPHASLNYIWANREHAPRILPSPYTDRSQMVILRAGSRDVGQWVEETVNILEDYRVAFGEDPPHEASLAIMSDADNTGESAVAYVDYIEIGSSENGPDQP